MSSSVRERFSRFELRDVNLSRPFGLNPRELVAVILAIVAVLVVIVYYFTMLIPARERLRSLETQLASQQEILLKTAQPGSVGEAEVVDQAQEALKTLDIFRLEMLKPPSESRIALINDINQLAKKHNLTLMSGIEMKMEAAFGQEEEQKPNESNKKLQDPTTLFPRMSAQFTVAGQYPNLRAFINELERNKQFLIINSITLAAITGEVSAGGGQRASGISLTIALTDYFQP